MFAPGGFGGSELGDVDVVSHGGELHLFHLTLPNHDVVGHAVSRDGLRWERRPPALHTGAPGEPDDDMIWTVGVAPSADGWLMLYTALSTAERGLVQRVAAATSTDLITWRKGGVVCEADPRWYESAPGSRWVSWRDPKPFHAGDQSLAVLCARARSGPQAGRGVVALLRREDGWVAEPPLFAPGRYSELECPQVFRLAGRWYLTASVLDDRSQRYWVSDDVRGPWVTLGDGRLLPDGHYAARVVEHEGQVAALCWHEPPGPEHGRQVADRCVPSPLVLDAAADGAIACRSWPAWASRLGERASHIGDATLSAPTATAARPLASSPGPCELRARVDLAAPECAVGIADADWLGHWVELDREAGEARLVHVGPSRSTSTPWAERSVVQRGRVSFDTGRGSLSVRFGQEIEVAVDDRVVLASRARGPLDGDLMVRVHGGDLALSDAGVRPIVEPR